MPPLDLLATGSAGIWLRTGIAGLQSAGVWAETSSLFWLDEEPPAYWDAGFVSMSQGLRRTGLPDSSPRPYELRRPHFSQIGMLDLCECHRDCAAGLQYAAIWAKTSSLFSEQRPRDMTQRNMIQRYDPEEYDPEERPRGI